MSEERDQIVCFCHNVSEGEILKAIQEGATTLAEIQEKTAASTGCGGCEGDILELLEKARAASR